MITKKLSKKVMPCFRYFTKLHRKDNIEYDGEGGYLTGYITKLTIKLISGVYTPIITMKTKDSVRVDIFLDVPEKLDKLVINGVKYDSEKNTQEFIKAAGNTKPAREFEEA